MYSFPPFGSERTNTSPLSAPPTPHLGRPSVRSLSTSCVQVFCITFALSRSPSSAGP
ncbi:hypothetical protein AAT19DRAFT_10353 [Rhodotorula toruloides]|uniref:Uncharacterized protein n=1 Tax=Rhodotorula toruloides TaxID=5286 RepID=A0A2T0A0G6_RHOTO|nr:hypothetical protein AAT19DRAFT_10353 [Rhodotorula toruloides]